MTTINTTNTQVGQRQLPRWEQPLFLAFTAVLAGFLTTWYRHPAVGLSLIGLDISEWIKFLPQLQAGQVVNRNWFYLPPILLGMLIALTSAGWSNRRWQTWVMRLLAIAVSLLAFPAIEAIRFEAASEWRIRVLWIGVVVAVALAAAVLGRWPRIVWLVMLLVAAVGVILPTYAYVAVQPHINSLLTAGGAGWQLGRVGMGVVLTCGGFLVTAGVLIGRLRTGP